MEKKLFESPKNFDPMFIAFNKVKQKTRSLEQS